MVRKGKDLCEIIAFHLPLCLRVDIQLKVYSRTDRFMKNMRLNQCTVGDRADKDECLPAAMARGHFLST